MLKLRKSSSMSLTVWQTGLTFKILWNVQHSCFVPSIVADPGCLSRPFTIYINMHATMIAAVVAGASVTGGKTGSGFAFCMARLGLKFEYPEDLHKQVQQK
jgi:hypothetical protein